MCNTIAFSSAVDVSLGTQGTFLKTPAFLQLHVNPFQTTISNARDRINLAFVFACEYKSPKHVHRM
jgi:hypothetical protein